uniref:Obscurin n=1 Tax=Cyclopterus lumpus TaxID=8103 RepID=A0A8C3GCI7_CYCLU
MKEGSRTVAELTVLGNITKKLPRRTVVPVSDTVIFCVELEHPFPDAYWTRNGEKLKKDSRISIACTLRQYTLTIRDCQADDSGEVAFVAGDCKTSTRKHPPDPPVDAVVQNKTDSSVTIRWSPPDSDRPVPIKGYIVEKKKIGTQTWQRCNAGETVVSTEITVCSFTEEATYQFRISAMNDFGQSPHLEVPGSFFLGETAASVSFSHVVDVATSGEEFSISVELSAVCSGFWSLGGRLLRSGADYLITRSKNTHTLLIRVVTAEMNGAEVKFVGGGSQSGCILSVTGMYALYGTRLLPTEYWYSMWLFKDQRTAFVSKGTQRKLVIKNAKKRDEGHYSCETAADKVTFQVKIKDMIDMSLPFFSETQVKATLSQKATLSCSVSDGKTEVKWYKDGKLLISSRTIYTEAKGDARQLVIEKVEKSDAGEYTCEAGEDKLVFKIFVSATSSQKATLSCELADTKTEVKWYKDGKLLTSSKTIHTDRQLVIDSVEKKDAGEYVCEAGAEKLATPESTSARPGPRSWSSNYKWKVRSTLYV